MERIEATTRVTARGHLEGQVDPALLATILDLITSVMEQEVTFKNVKCKTGGLIPRKGDARYERYPNIEMTVEINNKRKAKEVDDTLKDEVVERKMLGPAVVQRTKDMIDLIRGRLVVAQDGHDTKGQRV
ncbi:hypothetical protein AgCh_037980 [Apium graveolens]